MCISIIADDLTGACDTAVKVKNNNIEAKVLLKTSPGIKKERLPKVFAINTDSRALDKQEAFNRVYDTVTRLKRAGINKFYKKIDSLFRGNEIEEIKAMMDALSVNLAIIVPAAPLNDRMIVNGMLMPHNGVVGPVPVLQTLCGGTGIQCAVVTLSTVRHGAKTVSQFIENEYENGAQIILIDAENQDDLEIISKAFMNLKFGFLPVGTSGFILPLLQYWEIDNINSDNGYREEYLDSDIPLCPVLTVIGSCHPITSEQVKKLSKLKNTEIVYLSVSACVQGDYLVEAERVIKTAKEKLDNGTERLIIAVDSIKNMPIKVSEDLNSNIREINLPVVTECIAQIGVSLIGEYCFKGMILSGGDTAQSMFDALNANDMELVCEPLPGIAVGNLNYGNSKEILVATKSGGFGDDDALIKINKFFDRGCENGGNK